LKLFIEKKNRVKKILPLASFYYFVLPTLLAKEKLVSAPLKQFCLQIKKEWMLTEDGYSRTLELLHIPLTQKEILANQILMRFKR